MRSPPLLLPRSPSLPRNTTPYVWADSNRPLRACYNVMVGLVMSAVWHNTASGPLLSDLVYLCKKFIANGHELNRVLRVVHSALSKDYSFLALE